jgi:hypothetical protein
MNPQISGTANGESKKDFPFLHNHLPDFIEDFLSFVSRRHFFGVAFDKKIGIVCHNIICNVDTDYDFP